MIPAIPSYALSPDEIAVRLGVAALCGLLIGLDREIKRKSVGVRTFLLVAMGSAGFAMMVSELITFYGEQSEIAIDPSRIVQGIVTGIGFLGGGAILQSKGHVTGVASGASVWVSGAIGVACGYGFYWIALLLTAYAAVVLAVIGYLRTRLRKDLDSDDARAANDGMVDD